MNEKNNADVMRLRTLLRDPLLTDPESEVRGTANTYLGGLAEETAERVIADVVAVSSDADRALICMRLGVLHSGIAVRALVTRLMSDESTEVRIAAAWALMQIGDGTALEGLAAATKDSSNQVVELACAALTKLMSRRVISVLLSLLDHRSWDVRLSAATGLLRLRIRDEQVLLALQDLTASRESASHDSAVEELRAVSAYDDEQTEDSDLDGWTLKKMAELIEEARSLVQ